MIMSTESEVKKMLAKKIGRPVVGQPKPIKLTVRVTEQALQALDTYCSKHNLSRADGVRLAINDLRNK